MTQLALLVCTCQPARRCRACSERSRAILRLLRFGCDPRELDPVTYWDRRTSLADARAALCLTGGCSVDEIDPSGGYDQRNASRRCELIA